MGENFKVRCMKSNNHIGFTKGKIYEFKNGVTTWDDGNASCKYDSFAKFIRTNGYEDTFEIVNKKQYSGEYIKIQRKTNKVVAMMFLDGEFKKSANVKLKDADGDFEMAAKLVVEKLLDKSKKETHVLIEDKPIGGNSKAKCIKTSDFGLTKGKVYEIVNGYSSFNDGTAMPQYEQNGVSIFRDFSDMRKWFAVKGWSEFELVEDKPLVDASTNTRIVKQDKYETGDKVRLVSKRPFNWNADGEMDKFLSKTVILNKVIGTRIYFDGIDDWYINFSDIEGKVVDETEESTPLTANGFKVGDRVRSLINVGYKPSTKGEIGTIKKLHDDNIAATVEFDSDINGHSGVSFISDGKEGHCWHLELSNLELIADLTTIDWDSFKSGKFAVHCDTEEKAKAFLMECDEQGIKWCWSGKKASDFCVGATGYCCFHAEGKLGHCPKSFYIDRGLTVIDYIPTKPTYKEVERKAKVGEYAKIINAKDHKGNYKNGDILKVIEEGPFARYGKGRGCFLYDDEYVVLEGYQPNETTPVDSEPTDTNQQVKVGDKIKIISDEWTGLGYEVGDIFEVVSLDEDGDGCNIVDNDGNERYLTESEYQVISSIETKSFRKAKVGDKIKVTKIDIRHMPKVKIGDVQTVDGCESDCISTKSGNVFFDKRQEYIIIEESKDNPKLTEIKPGDTVEIIDRGCTCDTYRGFVEKYANDFIGKYSNGHHPKHGAQGIVIAIGEHERYKTDYYAVLADNKIFCISEKGIKKVD